MLVVVDFYSPFSAHDRPVTKKLARPGLFLPPMKKQQYFPSCYNQLEN